MTLAMIDTGGVPAPMPGPSTGDGITPERIYQLWVTRKNKSMRALQSGEMIVKVYEGKWDVALPEIEKKERIQVANLINQGVEQDSLRISSTMPNIMFPPENNSRAAKLRAQERRQIMQGWHEVNRMPLKFRRRARQLIALKTSPVYVRPGPDMVPVWEVWDPLSTFPAPGAPDDYVPSDVVYHFKRSWRWLQDTYRLGTARLPLAKNASPEGMIDCLLYCDAHEMTMIAVAKDDDGQALAPQLLQRVPNLTHKPCVIVPGRISLSEMQGQFDQMIGMYEAQGLLWAMHLQAIKRAIFKETWLVGDGQNEVKINVQANALTGVVGEVEGGKLETFATDPGVQTLQSLNMLERNQRLTGGIPAEFGGESGSNVRTARRGTQVLSSAIDFPNQESQDILAASLREENKAAIAVAKAYWPTTPKTLYVTFGDGQVTYTPNDAFPFDEHAVKYAFSGVSADGLVVEGLQRVGAGTLSNEGFMEIDPLISDPVFEKGRVTSEQIEKALLSSIQQQAADPNGPYQPKDIAWLLTTIRDGKVDLATAIEKLHARLQAEQAKASQGQLTDQQMQPGLAMAGAPGTPQAAQPGATPGPAPDQQGLAALMGSLRNVQRGVPAQPGQGAV